MKTVIVPGDSSPYSTSKYLYEALGRRVNVRALTVLEPDSDVLGTLLVNPTAEAFSNLPEPVITLFNDRLSRMPLPWVKHFYDRSKVVFCLNKPEPLPGITRTERFEWLPGAYSPEVHQRYYRHRDGERLGAVGYVGTFNAWRKYRFLQHLADKIGTVGIWGNNWSHAPAGFTEKFWHGAAGYGENYAELLSSFHIIPNILESRWGPNRKCFEIPHQALMLAEWAPGVRDLFGEQYDEAPWVFQSPNDLARSALYYADNPSEISVHRAVQQKIIKPYTYDFQAMVIEAAFER